MSRSLPSTAMFNSSSAVHCRAFGYCIRTGVGGEGQRTHGPILGLNFSRWELALRAVRFIVGFSLRRILYSLNLL